MLLYLTSKALQQLNFQIRITYKGQKENKQPPEKLTSY
jgi:hypothetical protein